MEHKKKSDNIVLSALFSAIIAIISQIYIPTPFGIPITLQTFAVALCGYTLKTKQSVASVAVYIAVGLIGLPVFSGFRGGIHHLLGPTGGFLIGFLMIAFLCSILPENKKNVFKISLGVLGVFICHLLGILQFSLITVSSLTEALISVSLPFIIKDIVSLILAFILSRQLKKLIL